MKTLSKTVSLVAIVGFLLLLFVQREVVENKQSVVGESTVLNSTDNSEKEITPHVEASPLDKFESPGLNKLPAEIRPLADKGARVTYQDIRKLGKNLSYEERLAVYDWIRSTPTDRNTLFYKDAALNKLERQDSDKEVPDEYASQLCDMAQDKSLDPDLRGYVLQHMRFQYGNFTAEDQKRVIEISYEGLSEIDNEVGGTSLLNLVKLNQSGVELDLGPVKEAVKQLAGDESAKRNKVTAFSAMGELNMGDQLPALKSVIDDPATPVGVRVAAVASFSRLAGESENDYLEDLKQRDNGLYAKAVANNRR